MSEDKKYGIIREQGEFMEPVYLKPEENTTVNESTKNKDDNNKK